MLGGMPGGMTMTKDPNDPFNMKTLKSIPNIANIPSLSSTAGDSYPFQSAPRPNFTNNKFKNNNPVKPPVRPYPPKNYPGPGPGFGGQNYGNANGGRPGNGNGPYRGPQNGHGYSNNGKDNYPSNFKTSASTNNNNYHPSNGPNPGNTYNDDGFSPILNPYMNQNDNFNPLAWRQDYSKTPYNSNQFSSSPTKRPTPEPQLYLRTYRRVPNNGPSGKTNPKHNREPETSLRPPPPMFRKKFVSKES